MCWLSEQQPPQETAAVEARRHVSHLRKIAVPHVDQVLDDPAARREHRAEVEEEEEAEQPDAGRGRRLLDELRRLLVSRYCFVARLSSSSFTKCSSLTLARRALPLKPERVPECNTRQNEIHHSEPQRKRIEQVPPRDLSRRSHRRRDKRADEAARHVHGMDKRQPAMRALWDGAGNPRVCVRVLEGLADAHEPKRDDKESEGRFPGPEGVSGDLECGSEGEHGAKVEILAEVGIGNGGKEPAEEVGAVAGEDVGVS